MKTKDYGTADWRGLPIKRPFPWEREMKVCIAAGCTDNNGEKKIVVCTDKKSSSAFGSTETSDKDVRLPNGWRCLTSGIQSDILSLTQLYEQRFADISRLTAETIDEFVKWPLHQRKKQLAEEYVRRRFSMSHDEFLQYGKDRLPAELFFDAHQKIGQLEINAEVIIAGFIYGQPEIYSTENSGVARAASNFAVVGEGEYIASSALLRREQHDWMSLDVTLYNVFEAKKLSEAVGSVGRKTVLAVMDSDELWKMTSRELDEQLNMWFVQYGPKPIPRETKFTGEYYFDSKS